MAHPEPSKLDLSCLQAMAESALKKLEEIVQCKVCLKTCTNPRMLRCNHIYCYNCLRKLVVQVYVTRGRGRALQPSITCPACHSCSFCDASDLPSFPLFNSFLRIQDSLRVAIQPVASSAKANSSAASPKLSQEAEWVLKKLEELLQCERCLKIYTNPKQLPCSHIYCQNCLSRLVRHRGTSKASLQCPSCCSVVNLSPSGAFKLPSALHANLLLEILEFLEHSIRPVASSIEAGSSSVIQKSSLCCTQTAEKALKLLEKQLQCKMCLKIYITPKQLPCNHIYCQSCISKRAVERQAGRGGIRITITCPVCQVYYQAGRNASALPSANRISNLLKIRHSLKLAIEPVASPNSISQMFEEVLKKVKEQVQCKACQKTYTRPKQLPCSHIYCQDCLSRLAVQNRNGDTSQSSLKCPTCHLDVNLSHGETSNLPPALHVNSLLEILKLSEQSVASSFKSDSFSAVQESTQMVEKVLKMLEEQLRCKICLKIYTSPKLLPCGHIFCCSCLSKLEVRRQTGRSGRLLFSLKCPACPPSHSASSCRASELPIALDIKSLLKIQNSLKLAIQAVDSSTSPAVKKVLKDLERQLQCKVCLRSCADFKILPCRHFFCQTCLSLLAVNFRVNCPTCQLAVNLPNRTSGLPSFQIHSYLYEIRDLLKLAIQPQPAALAFEPATLKITAPEPSALQPPVLQPAALGPVALEPSALEPATLHPTALEPAAEAGSSTLSQISLGCSQHKGEELKLFCETCQELICYKCAIRKGNHYSHLYDEIAVAIEMFKEHVASSLPLIESQLGTISKAISNIDLECKEVTDQQATIEASIHDNVGQFHELLEVRKTDLISELHQATQTKLQDLVTRQEQLKVIQTQLTSCIGFLESDTGSEEVLKKKSIVMKHLANPEFLEQDVKSDIGFVVLENIASVCQKYGAIVISEAVEESVTSSKKLAVASSPQSLHCEDAVSNKLTHHQDSCAHEAAAALSTADSQSLPNPSKCFITGNNSFSATVDAQSSAILHVLDSNSDVCQEAVESLACKLVSEITESSTDCSVQMLSAGQYEINYRPVIKGKHYLHVKINGRYIEGCPAPITVMSPIVKLGHLIRSIDIKKPWGVVINQRGELMVSEHDTHCISVFSPHGRKLRSFGSSGSQLNDPCGLSLDDEGNIIVADHKNHQIQKFTIDGKYLNAVGTEGSVPLQFIRPRNVAYNAFNKRLYIVDENHRVQILTSDFSYCGMFGSMGWSDGQFNEPSGIACDSEGNVFVVDSTSRIQAFTPDGQYKWQFGKHGGESGQLNFPSDIAFDGNNHCFYITERYNHRVSVFNAKGDFITCFGTFGSSPGELKYPRGLAVDSSGVVYVCDNRSNRLSMF